MCIVIYYLYIYTYIVHILYIYIQCIYIVISTLYIYIYMYCTYLIYIHCIYIVYIHCIYTHIHCMYTLHVYIYTHCIYRPLDCTYTYIHIYCVYREREIFALHIYTNNLLLPTISMFVYTHLCYIVKSAWKKKKSYIYIYIYMKIVKKKALRGHTTPKTKQHHTQNSQQFRGMGAKTQRHSYKGGLSYELPSILHGRETRSVCGSGRFHQGTVQTKHNSMGYTKLMVIRSLNNATWCNNEDFGFFESKIWNSQAWEMSKSSEVYWVVQES